MNSSSAICRGANLINCAAQSVPGCHFICAVNITGLAQHTHNQAATVLCGPLGQLGVSFVFVFVFKDINLFSQLTKQLPWVTATKPPLDYRLLNTAMWYSGHVQVILFTTCLQCWPTVFMYIQVSLCADILRVWPICFIEISIRSASVRVFIHSPD